VLWVDGFSEVSEVVEQAVKAYSELSKVVSGLVSITGMKQRKNRGQRVTNEHHSDEGKRKSCENDK
jgi:hypothetical protein